MVGKIKAEYQKYKHFVLVQRIHLCMIKPMKFFFYMYIYKLIYPFFLNCFWDTVYILEATDFLFKAAFRHISGSGVRPARVGTGEISQTKHTSE